MALITIKDLSQSTELDRAAMLAIKGGARGRGARQGDLEEPRLPNTRIVDYPPGFTADGQTTAIRPGRTTK